MLQVVACEQAKVDIVKVFGPEARPLVAQLTTEGQHRGAVIAALQDRKRDAPEPSTTAPTAAGAHAHGHEASSLTFKSCRATNMHCMGQPVQLNAQAWHCASAL